MWHLSKVTNVPWNFHRIKRKTPKQNNTKNKITSSTLNCEFKSRERLGVTLMSLCHCFPTGSHRCWREEQHEEAPHSEAPPALALHLHPPQAPSSLCCIHTADWTVCTEVLQFRVLFPSRIPLSSLWTWNMLVWLFAAGGVSCTIFGWLLLPLPLLSYAVCCWLAHMTPAYNIICICNLSNLINKIE